MGECVGTVGMRVGTRVGFFVGDLDVGRFVGTGFLVGAREGDRDGLWEPVGACGGDGLAVGTRVGTLVGLFVVGTLVGAELGDGGGDGALLGDVELGLFVRTVGALLGAAVGFCVYGKRQIWYANTPARNEGGITKLNE